MKVRVDRTQDFYKASKVDVIVNEENNEEQVVLIHKSWQNVSMGVIQTWTRIFKIY